MSVLVRGLLTSLSLIVAIGAQNAFVLRSGLARQSVGLVVTLCVFSDAALIFCGVSGVGALVHVAPWCLSILRWLGVAYIATFAVLALRRAIRGEQWPEATSVNLSRRRIARTTLALTFLNPHVYLDTLVLLGALGNQYGNQRWYFATGAAMGSALWFTAIGFGAQRASNLLHRAATWRIIDSAIALTMLSVAFSLARTTL